MKNVIVFGASVSAQSFNHNTGELTGYVEALKSKSIAGYELNTIERRVYPGNRLSDGGLIRLSEVLALQPDVCFFEPMVEDRSRGGNVSDSELLFVYASLVHAGILPITILLPLPQQRHPSKNTLYRRVNQICRKFNLPTISVDLTDIENLESYISSGPHTNEAGAHLYADQIAAELRDLGDPDSLMKQVGRLPSPHEVPVSVQAVSAGRAPQTDGVISIGLTNNSEQEATVRLVQRQRIGPWSPVIKISSASMGSKEPHRFVSIWDPYCHHERDSFVNLASVSVPKGQTLDVCISKTDKDPDYASCRREVDAWPPAQDRHLKPLGPLYVISNADVVAE